MKSKITVEHLKKMVQEFITMEKDETEDSTEWAYVALEPDLLKCEEVTLNYLMQINKDEFTALGENHWFDDILRKFKSSEILNTIYLKYNEFYGEEKTTDFYINSIENLKNYIK